MFAWLSKLLNRTKAKAETIALDAQQARAQAMTSLDAFYAHVTGGVSKLHDEEKAIQAYWAAEFAKLHGYIAKLESAAKAKKPAAGLGTIESTSQEPIRPPVVV